MCVWALSKTRARVKRVRTAGIWLHVITLNIIIDNTAAKDMYYDTLYEFTETKIERAERDVARYQY